MMITINVNDLEKKKPVIDMPIPPLGVHNPYDFAIEIRKSISSGRYLVKVAQGGQKDNPTITVCFGKFTYSQELYKDIDNGVWAVVVPLTGLVSVYYPLDFSIREPITRMINTLDHYPEIKEMEFNVEARKYDVIGLPELEYNPDATP